MSVAPNTPAVNAETFRDVIGRFATGVTVVTAIEDDRWFGTTASAVSSLSLDPPMLLVCMNRQSATGEAIMRVGAFAVNILDEHQHDVARRFARKDPNKFQGVAITPGRGGQPLLEGALAHLECRVTERVTGGTHTVFLAEVDGAAGRAGAPLAYFRGQFGRLHVEQDEQAHKLLRTAITERSIEIGVALDVGKTAQRLGVPERSAQQALMRLADEGLVTQNDGRFVVVPLTFDVVQDALRARLAVQLGAAVLGVGRMGPEQLKELRARLGATDPIRPDRERMDPDEWFVANTAFHECLLHAAESRALIEAHRRFTVPGLMTRATSRQDTLSEDLAIDHQAIVEAYEAGDVAAACEALRRDYDRAVEFNRQRLRAADGRV